MTDILGIGSSSLTAYRKLLETTGNNIANANTEGYVRRDVVLKSTGEAQMLPTARLASSGSGVTVDLIRRATDAFLQMQVRSAAARQAQSQIVSDGLVRIEKAVIAPSNTIGTAVQEFYAKAQDLTVTPSSTTSRLALIDAGQRVAESFRSAATAVLNEISSADTSLTSSIESVNSLATQIARLNLDISRTGKGLQKLNDLLDQRDVLLNNLSKLVNFTIVEKDSGSVDVYLGDSASGPKLVDYGTSRMLGSMKDGEKTELIFDPYGNANVTNQVSGGAISGLLEFQKVARGVLDSLNQLAVGFTNSINVQHRQGLDLNGRAGTDLFSAEGLEALPYAANRGSSKVSVSIDAATQINDSTYIASYSADKGLWTLSSKATGAHITGKMPMTLEGVRFNAEGVAEDGDTFSVEPLKNASLAMRFVLTDPASIAAAQKIYVDPAYTNVGTGTLTIARSDVHVPAPSNPSMLDLFKPNGTDTLSFRKDGVTFTIPAGSKDVVLSSIGTASSISFSASGSELAALQQNQQPITVSFKIDGVTKNIAIQPAGVSLSDIADAINVAVSDSAVTPPLLDEVAASVTNGKLVLTALQNHQIDTGSISGLDGAGKSRTYTATDQLGTNPADIVVFTREGVQISGPKLPSEEAARWVTVANGFSAEAQYAYRPDLAGTYRDMPLSGIGQPLTLIAATKTAFSFDVAAEPNLESGAPNKDGGVDAGTVYALDVQGLPPIRLSGDTTAGLNASGVADKIVDKLNGLAATQFWVGNAIDLTATTKPDFSFNISINNEDYLVTFQRGKNDKGQLLTSGTFDVKGPKPITLSIVPDGAQQRISIALPPEMRTSATTIAVESSVDSRALGLADQTGSVLTAGLTASSAASATALSSGVTLSFNVGARTATATIKQTVGATSGAVDLVLSDATIKTLNWKLIDGRLQLNSNVADLQIRATTLAERNAASSLGFLGADLTVQKTEGLFASAAYTADAIKGTVLRVNIDGEIRDVRITGKSGTTIRDSAGKDMPQISWEEIDGKLVLKSDARPFSIAAQTPDEIAAATSLGFPSGNAAMLGVTTRVRIASTLGNTTSASPDLGSVAASRSPVGTRLTIGATSEDLIVGIRAKGTSDVARTISVRYPPETARTQPVVPDFDVIIDSSSTLRIVRFDPADQTKILETYAVRAWTPREPIQWLGMEFTIDGAVKANDRFSITNGGQRSGDNRNALALAQLQGTDIFGKNQGSFQDVYASVSTKLGTTSQSAANDAKTTQQAAINLQTAFDAKTGVDLDREASDLIRYQQAYQAAAQVVKSAKDLFDTILRVF